jgi:ribonuclease HII
MRLLPYFEKDRLEAGCDEAGRGCLAGPVFAAAVILPPDFYHPLLNDSKQLNERQRNELREIIEKTALAWHVAALDPATIDQINILQASIRAMHRALAGLLPAPDFILVDGNRFHPFRQTPHACIIKGDGKYAAIAAASILAKTHRDAWMERLDREFPQYGWRVNKGYPTAAHRAAIREHGASPHHRTSFRLLPDREQPGLF